MTWPDSVYVTYVWDAASQLTDIRLSGSLSLAAFGYDSYGRRKNLWRGTGLNVTSYYYDDRSLLTALDLNSAYPQRDHSAPSAPYAREGRNVVKISNLFGWKNNRIEQNVDVNSMSITNQTLVGHVFHNGRVYIDIVPLEGGGPRIEVLGTGESSIPILMPALNNIIGWLRFKNTVIMAANHCMPNVYVG